MFRSAILVLIGLALSVIAGLLLARRIFLPIQRLQAGAAQIGAGALDQRIDLRTGDELQALGEACNRMAAQLRESYATLEQRVDQRTHDLAEALDRLRALSDVSQTVASSLDLRQVLTTIVARAVELSGADAGAIYEFDARAQEFHLRATHGTTEALIAAIREAHIRVGDSVVGETALRRAPVQVPDVLDAPGYALAPVLSEAGFHALLALPLLRAERVIGALGVRRRAAGAFGADTLDLLQTFASHSALAIQNAAVRGARAQEPAARGGQPAQVALPTPS